MATKKKFLAKHGLAVNTSSGSTTTLNYPTADGSANQFIKTDGSGALSFASVADNFLALSDTPSAFTGNNGKGILVKADGTGLEFGGGTVVNSVNRHELSGNGSTAFTLGTTYSSGNHIFVFVDGVIQNTPANYSLSGTTLTFTAAPENGADILVMGFLPSAGIIDVGDLIPDVDSSRDLGSTSKMFNNLFVNKIAADSDVTIAGTLNGHSVPAGSPGGKFLLATEVTTIGNGGASGSGTLAATASASGVTLQYSPPTPAGIGALATNGDGANLTNLSASALATGTVAMARISASALTAHINATVAPVFSNITTTPTTLSGYGITDAVTATSTTTLTNKTFDADGTGNSITNIENANIKSAAAIDAAKIADGTVSNTEFEYINSLSSNVQNQLNELTAVKISDLSDDTSPQLAGSLDVNGQNIVSVSNGNIALIPDGSGQTRITNLQYDEDVHDIGTTGGTITPDVTNGNIQTIVLNSNLTINALNNPIAGQSLTLIINTNGTGRTLTSSFLFAGGNKTLSTSNTKDIMTVFYDGSNYYANLVTNYS
tara:strand:+ start:426 stop:2066 length:1641 start_codon:yes stop_codon:yes gene_type:complete